MCILSLDIGGTFTKWGIFKENQLIRTGEFKSNASLGAEVLLNSIDKEIPSILPLMDLKGIAISSAGTVDHIEGKVIQASDAIPNYTGTDLKQHFESKYHVPVCVENDVNCAMYAEAINGSGKNHQIIFGLTIGTGVGSALIINKEIYHGANHFAGEIGYLMINHEPLDLSGSTRGLCRRVALRKNEDVRLWDGKKVFQYYNKGDFVCMEEVEHMVEAIATMMAQCISFVNPEVIIVGGGILAQRDILLPKIKKSLKLKIPETIFQKTEIVATTHGNLSGVIGAYELFQKANLG